MKTGCDRKWCPGLFPSKAVGRLHDGRLSPLLNTLMKTPLLVLGASALVLLGSPAAARAQGSAGSIQQDVVMEIDRLGDGSLTIAFRLSASQWTVWKQQYGDRPDVLWRDLRQQFAASQLTGFSLEKNDVERTAVAKLTISGGTKRRSDGAQEIELPKEMRKISDSGREWIFSGVEQADAGSPMLTQTIRVRLPPEAVDVRLNQPGTAFQALVYQVPEPGTGRGLLFAGLGALVGGLALGAAGFLPGRGGR